MANLPQIFSLEDVLMVADKEVDSCVWQVFVHVDLISIDRSPDVLLIGVYLSPGAGGILALSRPTPAGPVMWRYWPPKDRPGTPDFRFYIRDTHTQDLNMMELVS
jgi:hypothetical protein